MNLTLVEDRQSLAVLSGVSDRKKRHTIGHIQKRYAIGPKRPLF